MLASRLEFNSESNSTLSSLQSVLNTPSKNFLKSAKAFDLPVLFGGDCLLSVNYVERELECQICLSPLEMPVLLACNAHSLCHPCISSLFEHQKRQKDGNRHIHCPTCGVASGVLKVRKLEHLRVNRELDRIRRAYERERCLWVEEKMGLETKLNSMKSQHEQTRGDQKLKYTDKSKLSEEEQNCLLDILDTFNAEKLKEAQEIIAQQLTEMQTAPVATPAKKRGRPRKAASGFLSKEETPDKEVNERGSSLKHSASLKDSKKAITFKRTGKVDWEEETPTKSGYGLRTLKKQKTSKF